MVDDLGFAGSLIAPASADASFRRYFRVSRGADSFIVMDAPPDKEDLKPFIQVARILGDVGVNVPLILARHEAQGFLLLTDLGTRQYLDALNETDVEGLYGDALSALLDIQSAPAGSGDALPRYDAALLKREMELLPEWFLRRHLDLTPSAAERAMLNRLFDALSEAARAQPAVIVHRDYHSRNLLVTGEANPGIIDFQDAVFGPFTYDAVSLLKDCSITWPAARVRDWALKFRDSLLTRGLAAGSRQEYLRWYDLMGLQRHVKVLGIFARLYYRDGKSQYLHELPRVLRYAQETAEVYAESAQFAQYLSRSVAARFADAQARLPP